MTHTVLFIIAILLMLPGFIGIFLPIVPGIPYMFVVALIFGLVERFHYLTGLDTLILLLITIASVLVDHLSGVLGAKYGGASRKAMGYGFIGTLIGMVALPPFGGLLGLFAGILIAEIIQFQDHTKALQAAAGGLLGVVAGMAVNTVLGLLLLGLFIAFAIR